MKIVSSGKIKYRHGLKYQLTEDWWVQTPFLGMAFRIEDPDSNKPWVQLDNDGILHVRAGYSWDGASGCTVDTPNTMRPALFHDPMYQGGRAGKLPVDLRPKIDDFMDEYLKQEGMSWLRRKMWRWALRKFAGFAYKRQNEDIKTAP